MQGMDWNDLRYVLAVSRAGTLAAAARRLRVDQTTVARRLAAAERVLGARLFERIDGSLRPTLAGEAAIGQAARVEHEVEALKRGVAGSDAEAIMQTVRAGFGKSLLPCFAADADAGLRRLGDGKVVLTRELWLLTHGALRHHARIAAVVDWLGVLVKAQLA